jgi:hypothetical protein
VSAVGNWATVIDVASRNAFRVPRCLPGVSRWVQYLSEPSLDYSVLSCEPGCVTKTRTEKRATVEQRAAFEYLSSLGDSLGRWVQSTRPIDPYEVRLPVVVGSPLEWFSYARRLAAPQQGSQLRDLGSVRVRRDCRPRCGQSGRERRACDARAVASKAVQMAGGIVGHDRHNCKLGRAAA